MPADQLTKLVNEWHRATKAQTTANKKAKEAATLTATKKQEVLDELDRRKQEGVKVGGNLISKYTKTFYHVTDRKAFEAWAKTEDEEYLEPERRVRSETLDQHCREREQNKQPLPPGVSAYKETRVSKRKAR